MYVTIIRPKAKRSLKKIDNKKTQRQIDSALLDLSKNGPQSSQTKKIEGLKHTIYRKRTGRWRIIFTIVKRENQIDIWIIEIEKDTQKDYQRWEKYITSQL